MWGPKLNGGDEFDQGEDHSGQFQDNPVQAYDHPEYVSRQAQDHPGYVSSLLYDSILLHQSLTGQSRIIWKPKLIKDQNH
jgi:hypothetical protein